ncbi:SRPBCC family protein [Micromonospora sp. WP24]|uniref:SRPBCC family protein n=1 Tax=Micromonospora sp. WP24 TaxID=2604469 RepID=UPI0011DC48BF|nr:SRPBCC family protein [Micromonospora sp. WP24]TYC07084.1 SRPBCC family protein [Micromonospora sp. WP24]
MRGSYAVTATSRFTPAQLWALLLDAQTWPRWGTVDDLVPEQSEQISPGGQDAVGAVRAFRTGRVVTRERIVGLRPRERFAYQGVDNPVLSNYSAEVLLLERPDGGTTITWRGSYDVAFGLHFVLRPTLRRTMRRMVAGLAAGPGS